MITYFYKLLLLVTAAVSVSVYDQSNVAKYAPNHENYEPVEYAFSYGVSDPLTGDQKHHWEKRQGDQVQGEYGLMEPDGYARIVQYTANSQDGFQAIVKRIHVPAKDHTQGKLLYAENDSEQLYDNVRYGVTITHNVPSKQNELNTPTAQQRVDTNIVQRDINSQPTKIIRKNDQSFFAGDRIIATTFRPQYNLVQPKIGQYLIQNQRIQPQQEKIVVPNHQTSQIQVLPNLGLYTPNPTHNIQHVPDLRPQILQNQKNIQYIYNQQPLQLPIQLHGYQHNIQNIPVQTSQMVHYQSVQKENTPVQYQNQAYQPEIKSIVQPEPQQTGSPESDMSRENNQNVGYHEVQVQNEKIPTQVYKNYGYQNEESNKPENQQHENIGQKEYYQVPSEYIPIDTNKSLQYQPQIENVANPDVFERSKENLSTPIANNENQYQVVLQKYLSEYNSNGYQSIPMQTHNGRPNNILPNSYLNQYRSQFQNSFYQPNNANTNSQINLSQQKDIPVIFLHTHGKLGLPFLPSVPHVKFPIEQNKRYGYEDIPIQNITNINQQASSNINAAAERRNINIAERRNFVIPNQFHGLGNTQSIVPQQPLLNNLYSDGRRKTIWQAGDPTADVEPEILVRQINETCAYFRFNETTEGTEDGTKNNIWNAGDYSAQREEEELIRSVNVTCENFTIDVLSNFTGLYSLAEYCSQCLTANNDNPNEYNAEDFDMQPHVNTFVEQLEYTNFAPQKSNYANLEFQQNGYYNSAYQPNSYPNSGPQQNGYHSSEPQPNGYHASIPKQNSYSNIVLVNYQPTDSPIPLIPYPFGSYSNWQENSDYQNQPVRREANV